MDEKELIKFQNLLEDLTSTLRESSNCRDEIKFMACVEALKAFEKVILITSVIGDIRSIKPIFNHNRGIGFRVALENEEIRELFS